MVVNYACVKYFVIHILSQEGRIEIVVLVSNNVAQGKN